MVYPIEIIVPEKGQSGDKIHHYFRKDIAKDLGLHEAILLQHFIIYHERNKANDHHFYDGHYWGYNSLAAYEKIFYYLTPWQIRTALDKLIKEGMILVGYYSKLKSDRTKWYALSYRACGVLVVQPLANHHRDIKEMLDFEVANNCMENTVAQAIVESTHQPVKSTHQPEDFTGSIYKDTLIDNSKENTSTPPNPQGGNESPKSKAKKREKDFNYSPEFEEQWMSFGGIGHKNKSWEAWKGLTDELRKRAIEGMKPYLDGLPKKDGNYLYRDHFSTYLNGRMFDDALQKQANQKQIPSTPVAPIKGSAEWKKNPANWM